MAPVVTAIIVAYNSASVLGRGLVALRDPEGRVETLIVDNGSRDDTVGVSKDGGGRVIEMRANVGFARGCNAGAEAAIGRTLVFVNPDAVVPAAAVLRAAEVLDADPRVGVVGLPHVNAEGQFVPKAKQFHGFGRLASAALGLSYGRPYPPESATPRGIVETDWVQGSALAIRRDLYRKIGGMDPAFFLYFEDMDLCERVKVRGFKVVELGDLAFAIEHDERAYVKYHSRVKIYAWHRACVWYHEKHGRPAWLVRSLVAVRAMVRFGLWSAARLLRRVDADAYRMRVLGYADTFKFCIGWPSPLPFEVRGENLDQTVPPRANSSHSPDGSAAWCRIK